MCCFVSLSLNALLLPDHSYSKQRAMDRMWSIHIRHTIEMLGFIKTHKNKEREILVKINLH